MKKIALLTVLILSLAFSAVSYAAVTEEAGYMFITPEPYLEAAPETGILPSTDGGLIPTINKNLRFITEGSVVAFSESASSDNVVFLMSGAEMAGMFDRVSITAKQNGSRDTTKLPAPVRRYSAKVKLSTTEFGTTALFLPNEYNETELSLNDAGIFLNAGGAYINNADTNAQEWFIAKGTMATNTWYTVKAIVGIIKDGYVVQNASVYNPDGTLLASSGYCHIKAPSTVTASTVGSQIFTTGFTTGYAMIDDWEGYKVLGTESSIESFVEDTVYRLEYKLVSALELDATTVNTDSVKLFTDAGVDMTGSCTVSLGTDNKTITVTSAQPLAYNTAYNIVLSDESIIYTADGYPAFDYSNSNAVTKSFTTPANPVGVVSTSYDVEAETNAAEVVISNTGATPCDCLVIVASFGANGEYLETTCAYAQIPENTTEGVSVYAPPVTEVPGGRVSVMVWDNWQLMTYLGPATVYTLDIPTV